MADLFIITLADGIPVAGDGDVATINALMEDGALFTIGHVTDPANAATDATPVTSIALLKQLSKVLQDLRIDWPGALGAGGGLKVDGSGFPLPVTGTLNVVNSTGKVVQTNFTSGATAYPANAVVHGALSFIGVTGVGAATIDIMSLSLEIDRAAIISGETSYRLYLYNVPPPSNFADGAVFSLPAADRPAFLGYIDLPNVASLGQTVYCEVNNQNKVVQTLSASVYGYLVTNGPYTPTASNFKLTLSARQL